MTEVAEALFGDPESPHPLPEHADFVKVRRGNVHIYNKNGFTVCGGWYPLDLLSPANGDEPRQCAKCWDAM